MVGTNPPKLHVISTNISPTVWLLFDHSRFDLNIEPVFAVMALYDAKEKKKISESFHLDCNPSDIQHKWRDSKDERSLASLSRSAIFNITYPSSDIYLIIKVRAASCMHPCTQWATNSVSFPNPNMKQLESGIWEWDQHQQQFFISREGIWLLCGSYSWTLSWDSSFSVVEDQLAFLSFLIFICILFHLRLRKSFSKVTSVMPLSLTWRPRTSTGRVWTSTSQMQTSFVSSWESTVCHLLGQLLECWISWLGIRYMDNTIIL